MGSTCPSPFFPRGCPSCQPIFFNIFIPKLLITGARPWNIFCKHEIRCCRVVHKIWHCIPLLKIFDLHNLAGLGYQKYQVACMHQHNTLLVPFLFLGFLNNIFTGPQMYQEEQLVCIPTFFAHACIPILWSCLERAVSARWPVN